MRKVTAEDINQEMYDLYDEYVHSKIDRKRFLERLSVYAVGGLTVTSIMSFMLPDYQDKIQIKPNDPRIKSEFIEYESPKGGGKIRGLLSRPVNANSKLPGIVVVHENRGLNPHIEDVGRRAALAGFIYPDVNHGFHNDTTPRYDQAAAQLAWQRTIEFFKEKLM